MDHLEDIKIRIRERLKKLDEVKNEFNNLHNKQPDTNQYAEMIESRLKHIESIKNEIFKVQQTKTYSINRESISSTRESTSPIIPPSNPISVVPSISYSPVTTPVATVKRSEAPMSLPSKPADLPALTHSSSKENIEQRIRDRDARAARVKEAASSGCGCRKAK
jgi:hypothetical protein